MLAASSKIKISIFNPLSAFKLFRGRWWCESSHHWSLKMMSICRGTWSCHRFYKGIFRDRLAATLTSLSLNEWVTFWPITEKCGISINPFCSSANCWFVKFDFLKMRLAFLDGGSIWNVDYYGCFVLCSTLRIPFSHLMCPFIIGSLEWQAPFASCSCNAPCLTWNHIWHDKYAGAQLVGAYWSVSI